MKNKIITNIKTRGSNFASHIKWRADWLRLVATVLLFVAVLILLVQASGAKDAATTVKNTQVINTDNRTNYQKEERELQCRIIFNQGDSDPLCPTRVKE